MARIVLCRSTARRRPPLSRLKRSSSALTIAGSPSVAARAAASSRARGMQSKRRQTCSTIGSTIESRSAPAASARSRNSSTAVAGSSDRTATTCSPSMPRASRLVAITVRSGHREVRSSITEAALSTTCSQLSTTSRVWAPASMAATAARGSGVAPRPMVSAIVSATSSGSATLASSTNQTLDDRGSRSAAAWTASLVLPTPPTPVSVTIGCCRTRSTTRATSRSRPMSVERCAGRLFAHVSSPRTGGKRSGSSGWTTCHTRSGSVRSRSRWTPRSVSSTGFVPERASAADTSDTRI